MLESKDPQAEIEARKQAAGKFGFVLGCVAAVAALSINLYRTRPAGMTGILTAILMAALNVPLGIAIGLLFERFTRPK